MSYLVTLGSPEWARRARGKVLEVIAQLESEQEELLSALCEATRSRSARQSFVVLTAWQGDILKHPGLPGGAIDTFHVPDLAVLAEGRFVRVSKHGTEERIAAFDVTPAGLLHWEERQKQGR